MLRPPLPPFTDENAVRKVRPASINDLPIGEGDRLYRWPQGRRPDDHPGLRALGP